MSAWSFIAQRALTGEFLNWDVPLELDGLEWQLSAPGSLKGTVAPDVGGLRGSDGKLILEEWSTLLYAEHGGIIRWAGILITSSFEGEAWNIEAAGFSTYPHAVSYGGDYSEIGVDPATVIRHIWEHVQSYPDGNLGVSVIGAADTGVRLGVPAVPERTSSELTAARAILDRLNSGSPIFEDWTWFGNPQEVADSNDSLLRNYTGNPADRVASAAYLSAYLTENADDKDAAEPAEPYTLAWYEDTNCGEEIDSLAKEGSLDWYEQHYWDAAHENIVHEVVLAHPRAGRRRDDLVFSQGDNVIKAVTVESNGDDFANEVVGLGAGEGRAMLRATSSVRDGRLRRQHVFADKAVSSVDRMNVLVAEEMNARRAAIRVESIDVIDHANAPIGSWQLGDDVLVRAEVPWLGEIEVWCRVTGWSLTGENTATLSLVRSDLYRYGGVSA